MADEEFDSSSDEEAPENLTVDNNVNNENREKELKVDAETNAKDPSGEPTVEAGASSSSEANPYENEHYRWCHETSQWLLKETAKENEHYRWCEITSQWIPKRDDVTFDEKDNCYTYMDKDGTVFFYDGEKKAWIPKVDDDFLAMYQMSYGFIDNTTKEPEKPKEEENKPESETQSNIDPLTGKKRKQPAAPPKWFEVAPEQNTKVYVSSLPQDITEEEFGELMSKCGMVMKDPKNGNLRLKLYKDEKGEIKGDGLCHYIKIESVELALEVLDGSDVRGYKIHVERAKFQQRGEYNPALKPRVKKDQKEKMKKSLEKMFDWRPEKMRGERAKNERTVIIKNLFEPEMFDKEVHLIIDYKNDLQEECAKCGMVRKVTIYDRHPEGVAQVSMGDPEEADLVIKVMNGRFFGQRKLTAETWDGKTKYKTAETDAEVTKRLGNWEQFLEEEEGKEKPEEVDAKKLKLDEKTSQEPIENAETAQTTQQMAQDQKTSAAEDAESSEEKVT